jgi:hypothetical protein
MQQTGVRQVSDIDVGEVEIESFWTEWLAGRAVKDL